MLTPRLTYTLIFIWLAAFGYHVLFEAPDVQGWGNVVAWAFTAAVVWFVIARIAYHLSLRARAKERMRAREAG